MRNKGLRKISKETIDRTDVRQDEHGNIVFNFYDLNDTLCVVKYRPSHKIVKGKEITIVIAFIIIWEVLAHKGIIDSFITSQPSRKIKTFLNIRNKK